jgi:hypothetical protein
MVFRSGNHQSSQIASLVIRGPLLDDNACNANVLQGHNSLALAANNPNISRTSFMRERVSEVRLCQRIPDLRSFRDSWNYKGTLVLGPRTLSQSLPLLVPSTPTSARDHHEASFPFASRFSCFFCPFPCRWYSSSKGEREKSSCYNCPSGSSLGSLLGWYATHSESSSTVLNVFYSQLGCLAK